MEELRWVTMVMRSGEGHVVLAPPEDIGMCEEKRDGGVDFVSEAKNNFFFCPKLHIWTNGESPYLKIFRCQNSPS